MAAVLAEFELLSSTLREKGSYTTLHDLIP